MRPLDYDRPADGSAPEASGNPETGGPVKSALDGGAACITDASPATNAIADNVLNMFMDGLPF